MVIYARLDMLIYSFASFMILFPERGKHCKNVLHLIKHTLYNLIAIFKLIPHWLLFSSSFAALDLLYVKRAKRSSAAGKEDSFILLS